MSKTARLRELFERPQLFILAGGANAFEARLIEAAGFEAAYMSGSGTATYLAGMPDAGLTTMTEIVMNAGYMAQAIDIPLVSDADTGYGSALNVRRTVQQFIRAGVAGIHIEDQVSPKRCGFVLGKEVISLEEAVGKIRAAADARDELDKDFVLIARTDVMGSPGGTLEEAISRCKAYRQAGADVSFVEAPGSLEDVQACADEIGPPVMFVLNALPEPPSHEEMERMGISCAFYPALARTVTYRVNWEFLHDVRDHGPEAIQRWREWQAHVDWKYPDPPHPFTLVGFPQIQELERRYLDPRELERRYAASTGLYDPSNPEANCF